ncbi:hypothetical protein Q3G72_009798 [Acer saccharum]|nr:hypothetical protein Q3G72_009798 [Acer saccharum]
MGTRRVHLLHRLRAGSGRERVGGRAPIPCLVGGRKEGRGGRRSPYLRVPRCLLEQIKPDVKRDVQLKFIERLKDWKLHRRQRADGRFDTGLDGSKGVPKRSQTSSSSPSKGKSEKHSTSGILEADEKAVKEFLEMSYNNMTNNHVNGGTKRKRYEDLSPISPDPASTLNEEVPNKLDLPELSDNLDEDALAKSLANLIYDDLNLGDDSN